MNLHHPHNLFFFRMMKTRRRMMSSPSMHMGSNRKRPRRRNLGVTRKAQMSRCRRLRKRRRPTPWSMKQIWYAPFVTLVMLKYNNIQSKVWTHLFCLCFCCIITHFAVFIPLLSVCIVGSTKHVNNFESERWLF